MQPMKCPQEFRVLQGEGQQAWAARCALRKQLKWVNSHEGVSPTASIATPADTPRKERRYRTRLGCCASSQPTGQRGGGAASPPVSMRHTWCYGRTLNSMPIDIINSSLRPPPTPVEKRLGSCGSSQPAGQRGRGGGLRRLLCQGGTSGAIERL